jgi:hypothetical protein
MSDLSVMGAGNFRESQALKDAINKIERVRAK